MQTGEGTPENASLAPSASQYASPYVLPTLLLGAAFVCANIVKRRVGLVDTGNMLDYLIGSLATTFVSLLAWIFLEFCILAFRLADNPVRKTFAKIREKADLLILPGLIFPLFLACYTTIKVGIPHLVGYGWEEFWANADHALLGADGWQWTWSMLPPPLLPLLEVFYVIVWGGGLFFSGVAVALYCSRRTTGRFFAALMLTWLLGGSLLAYLLSAAGPVFAHIVDPALGLRFDDLRTLLLGELGPASPIIETQRYLEAHVFDHEVVRGGGVSAMPSMHVGTAAIFIAVSWPMRWLRLAAIIAWAITLFGSVHLGYHYLLDGIVATLVAIFAWLLTGQLSRPLESRCPSSRSRRALSLMKPSASRWS